MDYVSRTKLLQSKLLYLNEGSVINKNISPRLKRGVMYMNSRREEPRRNYYLCCTLVYRMSATTTIPTVLLFLLLFFISSVFSSPYPLPSCFIETKNVRKKERKKDISKSDCTFIELVPHLPFISSQTPAHFHARGDHHQGHAPYVLCQHPNVLFRAIGGVSSKRENEDDDLFPAC